jgi:hypothetical protein
LYNDAQLYPEWATTRFWEHLFNRTFFDKDDYIVSSQQPPVCDLVEDERKRVDLVVEMIDKHDTNQATMLFMEAKRASVSALDVMEGERQVFKAAATYYPIMETPGPLWCMTCVGTTARFWVFSIYNDYLIPRTPDHQ